MSGRDSVQIVLAQSETEPDEIISSALWHNERGSFSIVNFNAIALFADHLNTTFRENVVSEKIDEFEEIYSPEIDEHLQRWGTMGNSVEDWLTEVNEIREFTQYRPTYQRDHIVEFFGLDGIFNMTIQTEPQYGYVRINEIDIREGIPGVADPSSWDGIYFHGIPVEITAIPKEGYQFIGWRGLNDDEYDVESPTLTLIAERDLNIIAVFSKE